MRRRSAVALVPSLAALIAAAPGPQPATIQEGLASFYGRGFHGKKTASGAKFDQNRLTAAHPTYPGGTVLKVTNLENSRSVEVRVIDRGPAKWVRRQGVIIDLSRAAARRLAFTDDGRARVRLEVLKRSS